MTQSSKYDLHDHLTLILFPLFSNFLSPYHLHGSKSIGMLQNHWKRSWCWEKLKAGEGDNRGGDGWMASLTRWTGVWASSGSWWWIRKPGESQGRGSLVGCHLWGRTESDTTEWLNWTQNEPLRHCIPFRSFKSLIKHLLSTYFELGTLQ